MSIPSDKPTNVPSDQATASDVGLPTHLLKKLKIDIPGYDLIEEISRGGQATVYRATELTSGLTVAIKLLHSGPYADAQSRARLQREIAALKALNHPNIVCVIESGQTPTGLDYLVMNYINGRTLDALWRDSKYAAKIAPEPPARLALFKSICQTTQVAHRRGITHRDLSPSNILIDDDGQPHILDFGLASTAFDDLISPGGNKPTLTGQFIGKLAYASPEQARGQRDAIDPRTDVYALGVILYQILTGGAYPYTVAGNLVEVLNNIVNSKPLPPSSAIGGQRKDPRSKQVDRQRVNRTIEAIVLKALEKAPDDRYQSAGELAADVANYLDGKPTSAELQSRGLVSNVIQSRRWIATITAILALAIVSASIWIFYRPAHVIATGLSPSKLVGSPKPATWPANISAAPEQSIAVSQAPATQATKTETASADDLNFSQPFATASAVSAGLGWKVITRQTLLLSTDAVGASYQWPKGLILRQIADIPTNIKQESVRIETPGYVVVVSPPRYYTQHQLLFRNGWQRLTPIDLIRPGQSPMGNPTFGKFCAAGEMIEFAQDGRPPLPRIIVAQIGQSPSTQLALGTTDSGFALLTTLGTKWNEAAGCRFSRVNRNCHVQAVVEQVDGQSVTLRVLSTDDTRLNPIWWQTLWHLNIKDGHALECKQIELAGAATPEFSDVDLSGSIDGQQLNLQGTFVHMGVTSNETLQVSYMPPQPQPPPAANLDAANLSGGQGSDPFTGLQFRGARIDSDGAIAVDRSSTLPMAGSEGHDYILTGEAYFSSAAEATDNPQRKGMCFYFRQVDGMHRYELNHSVLTTKRADVSGAAVDNVQTIAQVDAPTDTWLPVRIEVSNAQISAKLGDKTGVIPGPLNTVRGQGGVTLAPGSKLRNFRIQITTPDADAADSSLTVGSHWTGTYTTMAGRKLDAKVTVLSVEHDIIKISMQTPNFTDLMEIKKIDSQLMVVSISDSLHPTGDPKHWECWDVNVKGTVKADSWFMTGTFTDASKATGTVSYNFRPEGVINNSAVDTTRPSDAEANPSGGAPPPNSDGFTSVEPLTWTPLAVGQASGNGKITEVSPGLSGYSLARPANGTNIRLKFLRDVTIYDAAPPDYIMKHADLIDSQGWIKTNDSYDVAIDGGGGTYHMIVFTKSFKAGQSVSAQGLLLLPSKP